MGSKSQTATITQNANHSMRQLAITDTIFGNENQTCVFAYDEFLPVVLSEEHDVRSDQHDVPRTRLRGVVVDLYVDAGSVTYGFTATPVE